MSAVYGDRHLKSAMDDLRDDDITIYVRARASCPGKVKDYWRGIVPKMISNGIKIEAAIREAVTFGDDPIEAMIDA